MEAGPYTESQRERLLPGLGMVSQRVRYIPGRGGRGAQVGRITGLRKDSGPTSRGRAGLRKAGAWVGLGMCRAGLPNSVGYMMNVEV